MKEKMKKLYFTNDFSPKNVQELQADGWIIRNAQLAKTMDSFIEQADEYGGDVPERYKFQVEKITVSLNAEIAPELQKVIDDTKAECKKVVAENDALNKQVESYQQIEARNTELLSENSRLSDELVKLNGVLAERDALASQVKDLEAKLKKQATTETKTTKAVETKE